MNLPATSVPARSMVQKPEELREIWAFIVGMSIYGLDALLLAWATDWLSVAFHGLALFFLFNGFRASRQLAAARAAALIPPGIAPPLTP